MMSVQGMREETIHMGMFDFSVIFVVGEKKRLRKYLSFKIGKESAEKVLTSEEEKDTVALGLTFFKPGWCPIVWIPHRPKSPKEFSTLSHEMFHALCDLFRWANIRLDESTEEVFAHAQGYLVRRALDAMKML